MPQAPRAIVRPCDLCGAKHELPLLYVVTVRRAGVEVQPCKINMPHDDDPQL